MSKVDKRIGQSVCAICGKTAHPGSAVVIFYGKGGRIHKACQPTK